MQVDRLRLVGFKSFVEAAELQIRPGLTGIVGPNGCGKSNLAEALRWVMGENSARRLRGGEMDDLIFAGAAGRPPRETAEVALILDNGRRTAPRAWNDRDAIEVVRRIERGGGSLFRINGRDVRARDVQVLFADAAASGQFGSVIGQGQVAALIEARPTERRQVLEEAAGTTGHQLRRREALGRLAAAESNLSRLDDVLAGLRTQFDTATRQARRARRYRALSEEIAQCERRLFRARRGQAEMEEERAEAAVVAIEAAVAVEAEAAALARARRDAAEAALPALRHAEATAASELVRLTETRAGLERELERVVIARGEAERRRRELSADREREREELADARATRSRIIAERQRLAAAASPEREREEAAQRLAAGAARLSAAEARLQQAIAAEADAAARRGAHARRTAELEERRLRLQRQLADTAAQREAVARELVSAEAAQAAADAAAEGAARAEAFAIAADAAEDAAAAAQSQERAAFEARQQAAMRHGRLAAEIETLRAALTPPVAASAGNPLLREIDVDPGFEAAIGALFDGELSASCGADAGADAFWTDLGAAEAAGLPAEARPLAAVVSAPAVLERRLAHSGWVVDRETGHRLQPQLQPGQCLVDRDGRLWRWDGFTRAEPAGTVAARQLEQQRRLAALSGEFADSKAVLRDADAALAAARADRERAAAALRAAQADRRQAAAAHDRARAADAALARRALAVETRLAGLDEAAARLFGELDETVAATGEHEHDLAALPAASALEQSLAEARAAADAARREEAEARAAVDRLAQTATIRREQLAALALEERAWRKRADGAVTQLAALDERLLALEGETATLADRPAVLAAESEALAADIAAAAARARGGETALARGETELREAAADLKVAEGALAQSREERARREVAYASARETLARLDRDIAERLGPDARRLRELAETDGDGTAADIEEIATRLDRLRRERDAAGPVNLVAESDAAELGARIAALTGEHGELTEAIGKLRRAVTALDREARARLAEAFDRVGRHFSELFVRLFGGGQAELRLTEDSDALSAGLEIMASPSGKRLRALSLLSGGEQALTALALIFAVFLTNPAPICVLDEVDAPLDDANVDRLCRMVAEIAETTGTRFLVVTHHRITMARADRLYGVTMSEPGVSRLVSVELLAAQRLRQTA